MDKLAPFVALGKVGKRSQHLETSVQLSGAGVAAVVPAVESGAVEEWWQERTHPVDPNCNMDPFVLSCRQI